MIRQEINKNNMFLCLQYAKYGWYQAITSKNQATYIGCNLFFSTLKCHRSKLMFFVISSYFAENVVYQNVIFSLKTHFESKLRNKRSWKDLRLASIYRFFSVISDKLFQKPFSSQGHILINCDIFSHDILYNISLRIVWFWLNYLSDRF